MRTRWGLCSAKSTFPARGTWIEIWQKAPTNSRHRTFPARGTWIEITARIPCLTLQTSDVPRKGNVDRNFRSCRAAWPAGADVPRKGNVDRNPKRLVCNQPRVGDVPRKGNVDRNVLTRVKAYPKSSTFPARGTWIEIGILLRGLGALLRRSPQGERG